MVEKFNFFGKKVQIFDKHNFIFFGKKFFKFLVKKIQILWDIKLPELELGWTGRVAIGGGPKVEDCVGGAPKLFPLGGTGAKTGGVDTGASVGPSTWLKKIF